MNTHDIELPSSDEAAAHMLPSDLKKFESGEHVAEAFSIAVGNPDETSQPLFTLDQVRAAIEADRKRRGEPVLVGWAVGTTGGGLLHASKYTEYEARRAGYSLPLYMLTAPQPAEPVKGQTGKTVLQSNQSLNEPVKVPSDADWQRLIGWLDRRRGYPSVQIDGKVAGDIADRLARYDQPAQPAQETIPRHVGETPAVPHLRDRLSEAHDACLDTNCVDCRAILREVLRILDSGSQPAGAAHE